MKALPLWLLRGVDMKFTYLTKTSLTGDSSWREYKCFDAVPSADAVYALISYLT